MESQKITELPDQEPRENTMTASPALPRACILYVDDDPENLNSFKAVFRRDYDIYLAGSAREALDILKNRTIQVLITDQRMPDMTGTELLKLVADQYPKVLRFMLTGFSDFDPLVDAINKGRLQAYFSKPIDYQLLASRIEDGLKGHYLELTNLNLLEEIRQNENFLNIVIENIPDMLFIKEAENLRFVRLNRAGGELLGYPVEDMIGKTDYDFFSEEDADYFTSRDRMVLESGKLMDISEETVQTRSKGKRLLHTKKIPIMDSDGHARYLLGVSRDVTEYRKLETQLRQAQKMEAIGTLAGGIAHDFNNILSAVIGYAELGMMEVAESHPVHHILKQVMASGCRARDLVKQILAFSRQSEQNPLPVKVGRIVREVAELLRASLPSTIDIQTRLNTANDVVFADIIQVHQILMNLCTNAGYAMRDNGGLLQISLNEADSDDFSLIDPDLSPGNYLQIEVADTGHGMTDEVRERIFDPFFTTKKQGEGTGLGLAVVYGIVKKYGGVLTVVSTPGSGTIFRVFLPLFKGTDDQQQIENIPVPGGTERILFVDDEPALCDISKSVLSQLGYDVVVQLSSQGALELFRVRPDRFDLVITDQTMPLLTGMDLAQEFMRIRPDIPVILCTGFSSRIDQKQAEFMGIRAFLLKPFSKSHLANTIRRVLDNNHQ